VGDFASDVISKGGLGMFSLKGALIWLAMLAVVVAVPATGFAAEHRDARENVAVGLIGPWKADIAASTYKGAKPIKALRTFEYDADGKVLVTFMTVNAKGEYSSGHWAAQVDGTPGVEYHSAAGSIAFNVVSFKKVDDNNYTLVVSRNGRVDIEATYNLSADGQTLTYAYQGNAIIYHRWDKLD
jgi:hypothetical protein